jgi:predicted Zn-dependent protease with MMP-like domain
MSTEGEPQIEQLLDDAESALDHGDPEAAAALCRKALELEADHPGAHFVLGDAMRIIGRLEDAVDCYRAAALSRPDHASSWAALALTSFELLDFEEASRSTQRAIRENPKNPEGWWVRAILLDWRGDIQGAQRALMHARWLDPHGFPLPPRLTDEEVEAIVEDALEYLHPSIRDYLANVPIILEDMPEVETLQHYDPPASPLELLGFFSGPSLMDRNTEDPWSLLPPTIVLYRRNLERHAHSRAELIEQLRITLFHEVGHFLGLDEADLETRGLD